MSLGSPSMLLMESSVTRRLGTGDLASGDIASPSPSSPSLMPSATLLIWPDSSVLCKSHRHIKHAATSCQLLDKLRGSLHDSLGPAICWLGKAGFLGSP